MTSAKQPQNAASCINGAFLILILLTALGLRIWGAFFDLPYIYHPDEPFNIEIIQNIVIVGDLNPHHFDYPGFLYYFNACAAWVYFGIHALIAEKPIELAPLLSIAMGSTYALDTEAVRLYRSLTICSGVLSVFLVYLIGRRALDVRTGLVAAMLMAISPFLVADCKNVSPDSYVVVFELMTILASLSVATSGRWISYVAAGAAVGVTAASKYNGVLVCICVVAAHFFRFGIAPSQWRRLLLAGAISAFVFLLCNPFALLDYRSFLVEATFDFNHYATGHPGMEGNTTLWYLRELWSGTGIAALLAVCEVARFWRHRSGHRAALVVVLTSFAVAYFLFICTFNVRNDRTLLPIVPCVLLLAAMIAVHLSSPQSPLRQVSPVLRRTVLVALGLALAITPLRLTIEQEIQLTTIDSRATAREWINSQLPLHSVVAVESYSPFVDPARFRIVQSEYAILHAPGWYVDQGVNFVVLSQGAFGRYFKDPKQYPLESARYLRLMDSLKLVKLFTDGGYEVYVYQTQPAAVHSN